MVGHGARPTSYPTPMSYGKHSIRLSVRHLFALSSPAQLCILHYMIFTMTVLLYLCYILCLLLALPMVTSPSPMNSVICLILISYCVATVYMLIGLDFLGIILIIIYVGAVAVFFPFVVMLVDLHRIGVRRRDLSIVPILLFLSLFIQMLLGLEYSSVTLENFHVTGAPYDYVHGVARDDASRKQLMISVGVSLFGYHPGLLISAGLLLLAALVGSIYLTNYKIGYKERKQYNQLSRRKHIYTACLEGDYIVRRPDHLAQISDFLSRAYGDEADTSKDVRISRCALTGEPLPPGMTCRRASEFERKIAKTDPMDRGRCINTNTCSKERV